MKYHSNKGGPYYNIHDGVYRFSEKILKVHKLQTQIFENYRDYHKVCSHEAASRDSCKRRNVHDHALSIDKQISSRQPAYF